MIIRSMLEEDLLEVCKIEKELFSEPWANEDFHKALAEENNLYLVAERDHRIVGYAGYWGIAGEGNIYNVGVIRELHRQKIGYQLIHELILKGKERGIMSFTLEVRCSNEPAISLYQSIGFESVGVRKDFYSKPSEDAVIMWINLIQ